MKTKETAGGHTALPWAVEGGPQGMWKINGGPSTVQSGEPYQIGWVIVEERNRTAREVDLANAKLIVRAVNAHDELVAACEEAMSILSMQLPDSLPALKQLRAALAKARGGGA
jgi:hypothetical protein